MTSASAASAADGETGSVKVCNKGAYVADFAVNNKWVSAFPVGQCKTAKIEPGTTGEVDVTMSKYTGFWWTGFWRTAAEGGPNWSTINTRKAPANQDTCYEVGGTTFYAWEDVFTWLTTTTNYTASPLILRCRLTRHGGSAPYGVGAVRSHFWLIGWFRERITQYDPPYATEYVVERSLPPSRHELGRMTFTEVDGGTHVRWTTRAEIPVPLLGPFLTRHLARPVITRTFRNILDVANTALTQRP